MWTAKLISAPLFNIPLLLLQLGTNRALEEILRRRTSCESYSEWLTRYVPTPVLETCERDISSFATSFVVAKCVVTSRTALNLLQTHSGSHLAPPCSLRLFLFSPQSHRGVFPFLVDKVRQLAERVMTRLCRDCPELQNSTLREDPRLPTVLAEAAESLVLSMAYG